MFPPNPIPNHPKTSFSIRFPTHSYVYLSAKYLFIVAVMTVSLFNIIIQTGAQKISEFERHTSKSVMMSSQMFKTFLGLIVNTGVIILIVNSTIPFHLRFLDITRYFEEELPPEAVSGIGETQSTSQQGFDGFQGFEALWYSQVGVSITITMLLDMITPHVPTFLVHVVMNPTLRFCVRRRCCCNIIGSKLAATQGDLNTLYDGGEFELPLRFATILNTLGMTLLFCGGIPALIPLCAVSLTFSYWVDKAMLLWIYKVRTPSSVAFYLACRRRSILVVLLLLRR